MPQHEAAEAEKKMKEAELRAKKDHSILEGRAKKAEKAALVISDTRGPRKDLAKARGKPRTPRAKARARVSKAPVGLVARLVTERSTALGSTPWTTPARRSRSAKSTR